MSLLKVDEIEGISTADVVTIPYLHSGTGAESRTIRDKFSEFISVKDYGAVMDGTTDDSVAFLAAATAAYTAGVYLFIPDGTLLTDTQNFTFAIKIQLAENAVIKLKDSATMAGTILAPIIFRASNSSLVGGTINANRAGQDKSAYNTAGGANARQYYGVYALGTSGTYLENIKIQTVVKNAMDFGVAIKYVSYADVDVRIETSGSGLLMHTVLDSIIRRVVCLTLDNDDAKIFPHAFDLFFCEAINGGNINIIDQAGYDTASGNSLSNWFSGMTVTGGKRLNLSNINVEAKEDTTMTKSVGLSLLSVYDSQFSNITVKRYTSTMLEMGACFRTHINNFTLDGGYQACPTLWPSEFQTGLSFHNNGYYSDFIGRDLRATTGCQINNGSIVRCLNAGITGYIGSENIFENIASEGNRYGVFLSSNNINDNFSTPEHQVSRNNKFVNCNFNYNEIYGFEHIGSTGLRLIGCDLSNNGQSRTTAVAGTLRSGGTFAGPAAGYHSAGGSPAVDRIRARLIGCLTQDDQTITSKTGSATSTATTTISVDAPELYHLGQTIKLVGCGVAGADLVTQITNIDRDELTVSNALSTWPTTAGTGTISTSGTTVTGSGTAFTTEIEGRTYIKNSTNYRRIIKVTSNTVATLESEFPSPLSGASFDIVTFAVAQIQSQDHGIHAATAATDATTIVSQHDFGAGNLTSNTNIATTCVIDAIGLQPITLSSADFESNSGSPAVGTVGGGRRNAWLMDAAGTESIQAEVYIPTNFGIKLQATLVWTNAGAGSGDVVWSIAYSTFGDGENLNTGDGGIGNVTITAPAQDIQKNSVWATNLTVAPGEMLYIKLNRIGGDAADTLANDAAVLALVLEAV